MAQAAEYDGHRLVDSGQATCPLCGHVSAVDGFAIVRADYDGGVLREWSVRQRGLQTHRCSRLALVGDGDDELRLR